MFRHLLPLALACAVLGGCTTWVKPGASELDRDRQVNACEVDSYAAYPPLLRRVIVEPAHWEPGEERCFKDKKGNVHCTRGIGHWEPARYGTVDENDGPRRAVFESCMYKYGWQKE